MVKRRASSRSCFNPPHGATQAVSKKRKSTIDSRRLCLHLSHELNVQDRQVEQALRLLQDGRTIPFIARYRKDATGGLDERQLRIIEDTLAEAQQLEDRRTAILKALGAKDVPESVLTTIRHCDSRSELEQLYSPWRSKRKTRADLARERGLGPLAHLLTEQSVTGPAHSILSRFLRPDQGVPDEETALSGACDIVAEQWSAQRDLQSWMLERSRHGTIDSRVKRGQRDDRSPFRDYFEHSERVTNAPAHRILAMLRGANEGVLNVSLQLDDDWILPRLERRFVKNQRFVFAERLRSTVADCYRRLLCPAAQTVVLQQLRERAERASIDVFVANLREMLMAPPAGTRATIGLDPGFRTGCKLAVVDPMGGFVAHDTIYPTPPRSDVKAAAERLLQLIRRHDVELIAIGNGTASRETHSFVKSVISEYDVNVHCSVISESGASIYSASETAIEEYPELDITVRGAVSIAHRLQDPMAELVKLDPATIGVGQYQHDVNQRELRRVLDREVESCVSRVGVNLNTASRKLLARVCGIGPSLADRIVQHREQHGPFRNRLALLNVPKLGPVAFEQASGFLRITDGDSVLDNSAVHPESYPVVQRMAARLKRPLDSLIANAKLLDSLDPLEFTSEQTGLTTVMDIVTELKRPGRDPRAEFRSVQFDDSVQKIEDLSVGMQLDGVVTNVTGFGAFVDIGVHHDALLHISEMADHFVSDATQEVSVGRIVQVRVTSVDLDRKRISLTRKRPGTCDSESS